MFKNVLRTGRLLVRRKININLPTLGRQFFKSYRLENICANHRRYSVNNVDKRIIKQVDPLVFEQICDETLESLCEYFEELLEQAPHLKGVDVTYGDGVLTVQLGPKYGTYVINRQIPNKQIWLSSPTSGPKRYDLVLENGGYWIYKHDGVTLHQLLQEEISKIINSNVDFKKCAHSLF